MALPTFVVLQSEFNEAYLRYTPDNKQVQGFLQFSGDDVASPYANFEVEAAKSDPNLVHIRSIYNNKYWVRSKQHDQWWVVAMADEPEEDQTNFSCTLFKPEFVANTAVRFLHIQTGRYPHIISWPSEKVFDNGFFLEFSTPDPLNRDVITIIDLGSLVILPKHVAFKSDNGKYLATGQNQQLAFTSEDIEDATVEFETFHTNDGQNLRIKSGYLGTFWRRNKSNGLSWIDADLVENDAFNDINALFKARKIDDDDVGDKIALRNMGNNYFCKRYTNQLNKDRLCAKISYIDPWSKLKVIELVLSRSISDVNFHLSDARIYDKTTLTVATGVAVNKTKGRNTVEIKLKYTETRNSTWRSSTTVLSKLQGVETNIKGVKSVPVIGDGGKIEISSNNVTGEIKWGATKGTSKEVETVRMVEVPPMTRVYLTMMATMGSCDVPFSYTQSDTRIKEGAVVTYVLKDGIYTGSNLYNYQYETREEKIY